jgi:hypothetical protein
LLVAQADKSVLISKLWFWKACSWWVSSDRWWWYL